MSTQPQYPPFSAGAGGGGKIGTTKRRWRFSPYNRPPPLPPPPAQKSSTWLSGAAKILSSVFISDSSDSESSDTDEESLSEDNVDCDNSGDGHQDRTNGSNLAEILPQRCTSKELGAGVEESGRKHDIMQLLLQETFSREECDELVKIINSRVLEHSSVDRGKVVDSALIPGSGLLNGNAVSADHAVMEARKFLEEKKVGRSPQSDFGGAHSAMIKHIESEVGSPADMAKSYMQARPRWSSRSIDHFELTTPSTLIRQLTSEEKLHSVSPLKAGNVFAFGAWSMQDEIRRVRSKATEDLLSPISGSRQINGKRVAILGDKLTVLSMPVETKTEDQ